MKTITNRQLAAMLEQAADLPRQRNHLLIHDGLEDPIQRLFIGLRQGTYIRPHRHSQVGETGLVVRGLCDVLIFDDAGTVRERRQLGPEGESLAIDLKPGEWHSLVVRSAEALFFEFKAGPIDPTTFSEFANWAPEEGTADVPEFLKRLTEVKVGESVA